MTTPTPKPGTLVYNRQGEKARYAFLQEGHHYVRPALYVQTAEGDEHEEYDGEVTIWHEWFLTTPRAKLDAEVAQLNADLAGLRTEIRALRQVKADEERDVIARKVRITQHEKLRLLDDYLAGRITHYVTEHYGWYQILAFSDAVTDDKWHPKPRLLTLFGDSKGDLTWGLSQYSTGSSYGDTVVQLCTSHDEAVATIARLADQHWADWRKPKPEFHRIDELAKSCDKVGIPVPDDVRAAIKAARVKAAEATVAERRRLLALDEAALAKALS